MANLTSGSPEILLITEYCMSNVMAGKIRGEVSLEQLELSCLCVTLAGELAEVLLGLVHWAETVFDMWNMFMDTFIALPLLRHLSDDTPQEEVAQWH